MLVINFSRTHDTNHINAQNAGLIEVSMLFLCKYSHIKAHANGQSINQIGHIKIQTTIHIIHHQFHRLVHQNFWVHNIGR